ncbi:acyltransferase family protein [Solimonas soli]|uniref:acyltransferase family protein n=1 Tax=Solimonas soli TaxID=413479 RepID=UPI0004B51D80|nr:acyltransferase [Solimonas soli]
MNARDGIGAAIPSLDGIRAVAILLVVAAHAGLERQVPGGLGVTVFFVLSGYLITTLLRIEQARSGSIDLRAFYLRRVLRLGPPLLVVVALSALLVRIVPSNGYTGEGLLAVLFYYGNYYMIVQDFHGVPAGIGVVWSLAVEEHFYLLYPPLALVLMRRCSPPRAAALLLAACGAVLLWRGWLATHGATASYISMATDTRIDAILAGAALAFAANPWLAPPRRDARRDLLLGTACVALLLLSLLWRDPLFRLSLRYTVQSAAAAGLLWLAVAHGRRTPLLNTRVAVYLGSVSYSVYLIHHLLIYALLRLWPQLPWYALLALGLGLSLLVAEPMRRWIERPCAGLRRRLAEGARRRRRGAAPAAARATMAEQAR